MERKGAVLPRSSTGSCGPCSYQEDHQALAINHDSVRTSFTKTICFTNKKLMIMMINEVKFLTLNYLTNNDRPDRI